MTDTTQRVVEALEAIVQHDHHGFNGSAQLQMESMTSLARSALALIREDQDGWRDISTAPREIDRFGLTPHIILGFAEDEGGVTLESKEGFWRMSEPAGWVSSIDPDVPEPYIQPTHWRPLPSPPTEGQKR